jgi:calcineurin-like phosphoesterase family protein
MTAVWFTSDTHFTHKMVAGLRGFATSAEHDEAIVVKWNQVVRPEDTVWLLGDVGLGKAALILPWADRLNGTIHLVTGNHDACWPAHRDAFKHQRQWLDHFASVQQYARLKLNGRYVLLSHFPYQGDSGEHAGDRHSQYRLRDEGMWLLHGHTHGTERLTLSSLPVVTFGGEPEWCSQQVHVGLDAWDLAPVSANTVAELIAKSEADRGITP